VQYHVIDLRVCLDAQKTLPQAAVGGKYMKLTCVLVSMVDTAVSSRPTPLSHVLLLLYSTLVTVYVGLTDCVRGRSGVKAAAA
jgi:hypothetical protein